MDGVGRRDVMAIAIIFGEGEEMDSDWGWD